MQWTPHFWQRQPQAEQPELLFQRSKLLIEQAITEGKYTDFKQGIDLLREAAKKGWAEAQVYFVDLAEKMGLSGVMTAEMKINPNYTFNIPERHFNAYLRLPSSSLKLTL